MEHVISWTRWVLAVATIMASPIALMLVVPIVLGIAFGVADLSSERVMVLLLWGPTGLVLLRRVARQMPPRQAVAA